MRFVMLCFRRHETSWTWCALNTNWKLRRATEFHEPVAIALHLLIGSQPRNYVLQETSCVRIRRLDDPVVHPRPVSTHTNNSCAPQVCEMPAYLWLVRFQRLDKEADAHFLCSQQVEEAQTRPISEGAEE
jgi:hypothetical protein